MGAVVSQWIETGQDDDVVRRMAGSFFLDQPGSQSDVEQVVFLNADRSRSQEERNFRNKKAREEEVMLVHVPVEFLGLLAALTEEKERLRPPRLHLSAGRPAQRNPIPS
jgi:hypothetical protein